MNSFEENKEEFRCFRLTEDGLYKGNDRSIFALRWSPPEVVFALKFSSRSDVWSFVRFQQRFPRSYFFFFQRELLYGKSIHWVNILMQILINFI